MTLALTKAPITMPKIIHQDRQKDTSCLTLSIPENLTFLEGHFPDLPIVPGVVQLHWAIEFARDWLTLDGNEAIDVTLNENTAITQIKFQQLMRPHDIVCLTMTDFPEKEVITYQYHSPEVESINQQVKIYSSGKISYAVLGLAQQKDLRS